MERLRVRSEKRPKYNLDGDSDDELLISRQQSGKAKREKTATEKFVRDDAVLTACSLFPSLSAFVEF